MPDLVFITRVSLKKARKYFPNAIICDARYGDQEIRNAVDYWKEQGRGGVIDGDIFIEADETLEVSK